MTKRPLLISIGLALTLAVIAGFGLAGVSFGLPLVSALAALGLLLVPYFLFGLTHSPPAIALPGVAALLVPYLIYGWGTASFDPRALVRLAIFVAIPTLFVWRARTRTHRPVPVVWDLVAVLAIWLPFDFRLLEGIWIWPEGQGSYGFQSILAVDLALVLFVGARALEDVGYRWRLTPTAGRWVLQNFLLFSAIAIPLGFAIDFIAYRPRAFDPLELAGSFIAILLFIGIPEELLFRGLIQNFLEQWWGKTWRTLLIASVVFGAAHLNNGDAPNVAYAIMATLAGVFYGLTFRLTGNLLAPAIVHALVDAVWRQFFRI